MELRGSVSTGSSYSQVGDIFEDGGGQQAAAAMEVDCCSGGVGASVDGGVCG